MKKRVAVLFGGCSSEHEVSLLSASAILRNLSSERYEVLRVGITKEGAWYLTPATPDQIASGEWASLAGNRTAFLSPDRSFHGIIAAAEDNRCEEPATVSMQCLPVDVVFPVLHGKNGEDGTIQGLLDLAGIPYVGCGTLASAMCMDKAVTHTILRSAGIHQADYLWFYISSYERDPGTIRGKVRDRLGYPVFVKPANAGSSVGVSKVRCEEELDAAIKRAAHEDGKVVVEEAIAGQEVECAVLGNASPEATIVGESSSSADFYDYDDKYVNGTSRLYIPARVSKEVSNQIRETAARAYRMLGCTGLARVDFFVRNGEEVILNELNTMPGFTSISMYPKLWEAVGKSFSTLADDLIALAFERHGTGA